MMNTRKITVKQSLASIAAVIAFHSLSYFSAPSTADLRVGQTPLPVQADKGDKAFKTHIFFGQNESKEDPGQSAASRRLVHYYGG